MKKTIAVLALLSCVAIPAAWAADDLVRVSKGDLVAITAKVDDGKLVVFGKTYDAAKFCTEEGEISAYAINTKGYEVAVHCAAVLDGDMNVVSVFSKTAPAKTKKVAPPNGSSVVKPDGVKKAIKELTGA